MDDPYFRFEDDYYCTRDIESGSDDELAWKELDEWQESLKKKWESYGFTLAFETFKKGPKIIVYSLSGLIGIFNLIELFDSIGDLLPGHKALSMILNNNNDNVTLCNSTDLSLIQLLHDNPFTDTLELQIISTVVSDDNTMIENPIQKISAFYDKIKNWRYDNFSNMLKQNGAPDITIDELNDIWSTENHRLFNLVYRIREYVARFNY